MLLKKLGLQNFRNVSEALFSFHPKFNLFLGKNGQGKTNLLEAIYLLSFGHSFRVSDFRDLIRWGENRGLIRTWVASDLGEEERHIVLEEEKKKVFKNGKPVRPDQFSSIPIVLFAPEAILLWKGSPQGRREYIDHLIAKCSATYGKHLRLYRRALLQRNRILKEELLSIAEKKSQLSIWDSPLIEEGNILIREKKKWIEHLNSYLHRHYDQIAGKPSFALLDYQPNTEENIFSQRISEAREEELARRTTLVGPHRDDFLALLAQKKLSLFGSQGEMRSFTLAIKLSEISVLEEIFQKPPILLLDDVLSELDSARSGYFFRRVADFPGQVFATATHFELFPPGILKDYQSWQIGEE